jgi:hypothetical protein
MKDKLIVQRHAPVAPGNQHELAAHVIEKTSSGSREGEALEGRTGTLSPCIRIEDPGPTG